MFYKKNRLKNDGFTVVELIIVILAVVILTGLVVKTHGSIQARVRNNTRQENIAKIQGQLEAFFSQNGYYPSLNDMNNAQWLDKNMKNLNQKDLTDPSSASKTKILVPAPTPKQYSYNVTDSSGKSCERTDTECAEYTLTATYEGKVNGKKTFTRSNID